MKKGKKGLRGLAAFLSIFMVVSAAACGLDGADITISVNQGGQNQEGTEGGNNNSSNDGTNDDVIEEYPFLEYFKYTLNEDGQSYSVGFWESLEEFEKVQDELIEEGCESMIELAERLHQRMPQLTLIGELVVPSEYNGLPVTSIMDAAFVACSFTKVVIPQTITKIGAMAFSGCWNLMRVEIGSSVSFVDDMAFSMCYRLHEIWDKSGVVGTAADLGTDYAQIIVQDENYTSKIVTDENGFVMYKEGDLITLLNYIGSETDITIPQGVTDIKDFAFMVKDVVKVTIPNSVSKIGENSFALCDNLISVVFENKDGWYRNNDGEEAIPSEDISNSTKMAQDLTGDYSYYNWYRKN